MYVWDTLCRIMNSYLSTLLLPQCNRCSISEKTEIYSYSFFFSILHLDTAKLSTMGDRLVLSPTMSRSSLEYRANYFFHIVLDSIVSTRTLINVIMLYPFLKFIPKRQSLLINERISLYFAVNNLFDKLN